MILEVDREKFTCHCYSVQISLETRKQQDSVINIQKRKIDIYEHLCTSEKTACQ